MRNSEKIFGYRARQKLLENYALGTTCGGTSGTKIKDF
jgi:hypothetical protein